MKCKRPRPFERPRAVSFEAFVLELPCLTVGSDQRAPTVGWVMDVSKNRGTSQSSILILFSIIKPSILGCPYFWKHLYSFIRIIWSHEIRISIYPTRIQMECHGSGCLITAQMEKFWIRFKTSRKERMKLSIYRMVNGILIIWKVIGSKCIAWILQVRCGARFFVDSPVSYLDFLRSRYWHLSQYGNLHCVTSFLGVPFVKASSSQKQRSSKLILKVWDVRAPVGW